MQLRPVAVVLVVVVAACGGAIDGNELFTKEQGSSSGTSGTAPSPSSSATTVPAPRPAPQPTGKPTPKPTSKCDVSFTSDVMQVFERAGCSTSSCHGGLTPRNEPAIESATPSFTYKTLVSFTLSTGQPYVVTGSTDATDSGLYCNVRGGCGVRMPLNDTLSPKDLATLDEWLACGAAFN